MHAKRILILVPYLIINFSCETKTNNTVESEPLATEPPVAETVATPGSDQASEASISASPYTLVCAELESEDSMPSMGINLTGGALKEELRIYEGGMNACTIFGPNQYSSYNVPTNALDALNSYYAGGGEVFYIVADENIITLMKGYIDEMGASWEETSYSATKIITIQSDGSASVEDVTE